MFLTRKQLIKRFFKKLLYALECLAIIFVGEFLFFFFIIMFA